MRRGRIIISIVGALLALVYLANASWLAPTPAGTPRVLAHRGVHQTFRRGDIGRDTCTATRMNPPTNPYLENTLPSMRASFAAGAAALELDVHPTTDGEFAVFHDWGLECRTNGHGVTRDQTMATLRTLDLGYGYTADGGRTFPFRGKGVGLMPTLEEVFAAFPGKQFVINIKSNDASEVDRLVAYLKAHHRPTDNRLWILAAKRPADRLHAVAPQARLMSKERVKSCTARYLALGWSGHVPAACRGNFIGIPVDLAPYFWGWPNRFLARMAAADVVPVLVGPVFGKDKEPGVSRPDQLAVIPPGFTGVIMTDQIEAIGPAAKRRWGE